MPGQAQTQGSVRATKRLIVIFTVTILAPALILGFFGLRALNQERRTVEQQIGERLGTEAESAGRRLELELEAWRQTVGQLARIDPVNPATWPARVRSLTSEAGLGVALIGEGSGMRAFPAEAVLYEFAPPAEASSRPGFLEQAQRLELRERQYEPAIELYRGFLADSSGVDKIHALHGLARALKKAGHIDAARRTYRLLASEPSIRIGSLPSDLIAIYELTALAAARDRSEDALRLYRRLVGGRWQLAKPSYAFYSEQARQWIPSNDEAGILAATEARKLALGQAGEKFLAQPRALVPVDGRAYFAVWQPKPFAAILLGEAFVRSHLFPLIDDAAFEFALLSPRGELLVGESATAAGPRASYTLADTELPLRLEVRPADPDVFFASIERRQAFYLATIGIVAAVLVFGGYLAVHTLKAGLDVAQMKADFASTVSHEFRSPLAGINQLTEMLRDGQVRDEGRRQAYHRMIATEAQRLRRLVENVLDFSRMEDGRKEYRFERLEPAPWLHDVVEEFRTQIRGTGFAVEADIPAGLPAILADREALTSCVHNLLDNAVKYSGDSRTVWLEASTDHATLVISVRDRGIGIREDDRPHVFERFFRGGGEVARRVKGVGLGLNLVEQIVRAHGGIVALTSEPGEGSTFTIRIGTAVANA